MTWDLGVCYYINVILFYAFETDGYKNKYCSSSKKKCFPSIFNFYWIAQQSRIKGIKCAIDLIFSKQSGDGFWNECQHVFMFSLIISYFILNDEYKEIQKGLFYYFLCLI